ncbi:MAG: PRD domain-containing protein [Erysipelotrichaceae bacterium]|nr:PRD domain-containing protein [Erysipelotrichaceae bacterium]
MYKVRTVLGNNAILVLDDSDSRETIFIGTGIGFGRKVGMTIDIAGKNVTRYVQEKGKDISAQLIKNDSVYLEIADKLITSAASKFENFDRNILIPLSDHIAFAISRMDSGLVINNPFKNDIKLLFKEEFDVAMESVSIIKEKLNKTINEDEVSYITLHLHSARSDMKVDQSLILATLVNESLSEIEKTLDIKIDVNSLSYSRLLTHLKYLLLRCNMNEKLRIDMSDYTKTKFPVSYKLAENVIKKFSKMLKVSIDEIEVGYLALHIERICSTND